MSSQPTRDSVSRWNRQRSRFNHDWLLVSYLTFLQAWRLDLDQAGETGELQPEIATRLAEWRQRYPRLQALLDCAERELSPALNGGLSEWLASLDIKEREDLRAAAHQEWLLETGLCPRLERCRADSSCLDQLVEQTLAGKRIPFVGARLYEAACQLSEGLTDLGAGVAR